MVSIYHPDINPSPDAHLIIVELNEAYEILSDPNTKWIYDQHFIKKEGFYNQPDIDLKPPVDTRKYRKGSKETQEQKLEKKAFAVKRNIAFNNKMKILSVISLLLSGIIFADHYLPVSIKYESVYASFKTENIPAHSEGTVAIFLKEGKKLDLYPSGLNNEVTALRKGEALFSNTPVFSILKSVQVDKLVLVPYDGLYNVMLVFGVVCMSSLFVLAYKAENSLVLPTILTFFGNMLILSFFTMLLTGSH